MKARKAESLIMVMSFILIATILIAASLTLITMYKHSVTSRIDDLRVEVYK